MLRPIAPEDGPLVAASFERLGKESRYRRFFTSKTELSAAELDYLVDVDHHDHEAIVAIDPSSGEGLGVARYVRSAEDPELAEVAVTVADDWQGRGLGRALLDRLTYRARREGVRRFSALVQSDNWRSLGLVAGAGESQRWSDTGEVELVVIELPPKRGIGARLARALRAAADGSLVPTQTFAHRVAVGVGLPHPSPRPHAPMNRTLKDKTLFISGGSRGIGLEIALRAARDGANVALIAKTAEPNPRLPGTVFTAAEEIEAAGGAALPIVGDIRDETVVADAVGATVERFGGIDVCVNNASAINLSGTEALEMKRYDLMQDINTRGTFVVTRACVPHLKRAPNPHILTLSPPISLEPRWLGPHVAYTIAKYGMSLCALGFAEEFRDAGIASNALWPRTLIATAAVQNLLGGEEAMAASRKPALYADAAYAVITRPSRECTGNTFLCEDVLAEEGVTDFDAYAYVPGATPQVDMFVDHV